MTTNRHGEKGAVPFRSGRVFRVDNDWYFATREVAQLGPYPSKNDAEVAMAAFVGFRIHQNRAFTHPVLWAVGTHATAGQSDPFRAMLSEAVQFYAARAEGQRNAALVWAVDRLRALRTEGERDATAGCRMAVLEHILETDASADVPLAVFSG